MENSNPQYTCISCAIAFVTADDQRGHYKSDHHRYNMKRRVAGLPPITVTAFNQKLLERQDEASKSTSASGKTCGTCRKTYTTENAYRSHIASKKHREAEAELQKNGPSDSMMKHKEESVKASTPSADERTPSSDGLYAPATKTDTPGPAHSIPPTTCLFCAVASTSVVENAAHMNRHHGFFIPDQEYLTDLPGLLTYLAEKIAVGNSCIWCNGRGRAFNSLDAVRKHMLDKSHCKIAYDSQEDKLEVSDFYDFTSSYSMPTTGAPKGRLMKPNGAFGEEEAWEDDDDVPEEDADEVVEEGSESDEAIHDGAQVTYGDTPFELVLPSGTRIGHRSLKRYYVQKFTNPLPDVSSFENSDSVVVRRLLKESKMGLIPASGGGFGGSGRGMMTIKANSIHQAKEAGRHIKEHRDARVKEQFKIKAGFKANNQKHYRDQLLQ